MTRLAIVPLALALAAAPCGARPGRGPDPSRPLKQGSVVLYARAFEEKRTGTSDYGRSAFNFLLGKRSDEPWRRAHYGFDVIYGSATFDRDSDYLTVEIAADDRSWIHDLGELEWSELGEVPALAPSDELRGIRFGSDEGTLETDSRGVLAHAHAGHVYELRVKDDDADFLVVFRVDALEPNERVDVSWRVIADYTKPGG